jgi:hypothetical protein
MKKPDLDRALQAYENALIGAERARADIIRRLPPELGDKAMTSMCLQAMAYGEVYEAIFLEMAQPTPKEVERIRQTIRVIKDHLSRRIILGATIEEAKAGGLAVDLDGNAN